MLGLVVLFAFNVPPVMLSTPVLPPVFPTLICERVSVDSTFGPGKAHRSGDNISERIDQHLIVGECQCAAADVRAQKPV